MSAARLEIMSNQIVCSFHPFSRIVTLAVAMALSACAAGPQFQRPAAPQSTAYSAPEDKPPVASSSEVVNQQVALGSSVPQQWWSLFNNDALNRLIDQALANNQTLVAAQATVQQAQALAEVRTGARYPELDLTAGAGRQKLGAQFLGGNFSLPPFTYFAFGAAVSYTLDYTGGVSRSIEQQQALTEYQQHQLQAARLAVTGNVVMRAIEMASIQAEIRTVEELLNDDRRNVDMVQAAFDAGSVSRVDLLTAQSQLATDTTLLPTLHQQFSVARNALAALAGREPAAALPQNFDLTAFTLPQQLPVDLPSDLVHQRPDILAAEAQLHATTAAVGVATANLYPRITLSASFGQQAVKPENLFDASSDAWTLISGLTAPIFDGGRLRAERRAALAALSADAARYRQVVLNSFTQVADALDGINHSAEQLAAQSQAVNVAQQSLDLTRESYDAGNVGVLQVLDSERSYQRARIGYVRAQAQRLQNTAQLFVALGRSN
jgi:NodT family efflux transporter outer membrane factor (OMF) lipoprotein